MEMLAYANQNPTAQFDHLVKLVLAGMPEEQRQFCLRNNALPNDTVRLIQQNIFYDIPFHHGFRINMTGRVINLLEGYEVQPTLNLSGYWAVTVRRDGIDNRSITAHVHRLLALTFLPLPDISQVDSMHVNHIDGNKLNNSLTNLEWVTHQRNCQHAYETGLRDDNTPIRIRCATTGNEFVAYSMGEAGRFFGVTAAAVHWQLNCKKSKTPYKGYYVEYADIGPQ